MQVVKVYLMNEFLCDFPDCYYFIDKDTMKLLVYPTGTKVDPHTRRLPRDQAVFTTPWPSRLISVMSVMQKKEEEPEGEKLQKLLEPYG